MSVQTTFKLNPLFIESTPQWLGISEIGITGVSFTYNVLGNSNSLTVPATLSNNKWEVQVALNSNTQYVVIATVTNTAGSTNSASLTINTGTTTIFRNIYFKVKDITIVAPGDQIIEGGLSGAVLTIVNPGGADWVSRASTTTGIVWVQRIPRLPSGPNTYAYTIDRAGFVPASGQISNYMLDNEFGGDVFLTPN